MRWFNNMSVRWKLFSIACLGGVFFLLYFVFSFYSTNRNLQQLQSIQQEAYPLLSSINSLRLGFADLQHKVGTAARQDESWQAHHVKQASQRLEKLLYSINVPSSANKDMLIGLRQTFGDYADVIDQLIAQDASDDSAVALAKLAQLQLQFTGQASILQQWAQSYFENQLDDSQEANQLMQELGVIIGIVAALLIFLLAWRITRSINRPLDYAVVVANDIAAGKWERDIVVDRHDETGMLLRAIRHMRNILKEQRDQDQREERIASLLAQLDGALRGEHDLQQLGNNLLSYIVPALDAQLGAFYVYNEDDNRLKLSSSYGLNRRKNLANGYALGESLVGQSALEKQQILLSQVPDDYLTVQSATGESVPATVVVTPILHEDELEGVLEIAALRPLGEDDMEVLEKGIGAIAVALQGARSRVKLRVMLDQSKRQADELEYQKEELGKVNDDLEEQAMELAGSEAKLQQQQEELQSINEELEAQTQALKASEESLQAQQEELRVTNEELESQAKVLSDQKAELTTKNEELEGLHYELSNKLEELELSSRYKSEFLSTMSHELRTPLNSILILSDALASNKKQNLNDKQVEHAQVIHSAGSDLLMLINDILDISKIEEGKMEVVIDKMSPVELAEHFRLNFAHIAENKGVAFHVDLGDDLPECVYTDRQRVEQIIKNLMSNSLKFTENGSVTFSVQTVKEGEDVPIDEAPSDTIKLSVIDTGIGIAEDKQRLIFEAFQQADGTTSRKYGGTGLGLTISRELAQLLKGEIRISSDGLGTGSTFTLYLPIGGESDIEAFAEAPATPSKAAERKLPAIPAAIQPTSDSRTVLVIEDDAAFAQVLVDLAVDYGLEGHVCVDGESGLEYAYNNAPCAIILDIGLPTISGWEVMEQLKADKHTQDIPVHFLSGAVEARDKALSLGAVDFLEKPVNPTQLDKAFSQMECAIEKDVRRLLVVEDSEAQHEGIRALFDGKEVSMESVTTGKEALESLRQGGVDCMILDLSLPDMTGVELLEAIQEEPECRAVPVIIYTGKDLSRDEEAYLQKYADRIILKTEQSSERLLNEASLFLHWLGSTLPSNNPSDPSLVEHRDDIFEGKKLLLADDDMRNIYALSAQLEELGFDILLANDGREAVEMVENNPDIDVVLMDIMMPEMDGYEAMQLIREKPKFAKLPILALTAKAMKGDRKKCIDAGASDYCSKPIDMAKLASLLRVWLH